MRGTTVLTGAKTPGPGVREESEDNEAVSRSPRGSRAKAPVRRVRRPRALIISVGILAVLAIIAVVGLAASGFSAVPGLFGGATVSTLGSVDFTRPLAIPARAESTVDASGQRRFDLRAESSSTQFMEEAATSTWGFNGSYLGPTLFAERGEEVMVNVANGLEEATTVHWHGMHLPAKMDGGPHQLVDPGATWSPTWEIDQPAATLWYHPHPHGATEAHVARGLAGLFILTDPIERALPLPREYGVDDIPVIVQDVRFDADGQFEYQGGFVGSLGDRLLVNGTLAPYVDVTTTVVRLRLVNASTARTYEFALGDRREFAQIASDGGLLQAPAPMTSIRLSPGERAEVLVTVSPGESVVLQSAPPQLGGIVPFGGPDGSRDQFDVLQLRAAETLRSVGRVPEQLASIDRIDEADAAVQREFVLDDLAINGQSMSLTRVDHTANLGAVEVWSVTNDMPRPHNFHIHGVQFQVLSEGGDDPQPGLAGWKDTVYLEPGIRYRLIMRFDDYSDPGRPYMYHCHLLRHEDAGMMGQFVVLAPGESLEDIAVSTHDH